MKQTELSALLESVRTHKGLDEDTKTVVRIRTLEHVIEATELVEPVLMGQIKGAGRRAESAAGSSERIAADLKTCRDQLRLAEAQRRAF